MNDDHLPIVLFFSMLGLYILITLGEPVIYAWRTCHREGIPFDIELAFDRLLEAEPLEAYYARMEVPPVPREVTDPPVPLPRDIGVQDFASVNPTILPTAISRRSERDIELATIPEESSLKDLDISSCKTEASAIPAGEGTEAQATQSKDNTK